MLWHIVDWVALRLNRWETKQVLIIKYKTVIYLYGKNSRKFACKRDLQVRDPRRDRDIWFSVRDETKTIPHFPETETRPRHWKNRSRDRLETETSRPRLQPWLLPLQMLCHPLSYFKTRKRNTLTTQRSLYGRHLTQRRKINFSFVLLQAYTA